MANHNIVNTTHITAMNVDAYNLAAVCASDVDNGLFVTLSGINAAATSNEIQGYEYTVALAAQNASEIYVVDAPEVGWTLEMQMSNDPRAFYTPAGKPMSIKYMNPMVDCIEEPATAFAAGSLPAANTKGQYVAVSGSGKLGAASAQAPQSGAYFRIEGFHYIAIGGEKVATVVLRCMAN